MHGGKRSGSGRKKSVANIATEAAIEKAILSGKKLPHEILLEFAQGGMVEDWKLDKDTNEWVPVTRCVTLKERIDAATAAAPYYASKMATKIEADVENTGEVVIKVIEG